MQSPSSTVARTRQAGGGDPKEGPSRSAPVLPQVGRPYRSARLHHPVRLPNPLEPAGFGGAQRMELCWLRPIPPPADNPSKGCSRHGASFGPRLTRVPSKQLVSQQGVAGISFPDDTEPVHKHARRAKFGHVDISSFCPLPSGNFGHRRTSQVCRRSYNLTHNRPLRGQRRLLRVERNESTGTGSCRSNRHGNKLRRPTLNVQ